MTRPRSLWLLIIVLVFLALGGLYGGMAMLIDPSGKSLDLDAVIDDLPVFDYMLPGLFLLSVMGLLPLLLAFALVVRPKWPFLDRFFSWSGHYWAWTGCIILAGVISLWLTYEGLLIGMFPITYFTAVLGLAILLLSIIPNIRRFYQNPG